MFVDITQTTQQPFHSACCFIIYRCIVQYIVIIIIQWQAWVWY